MKEALPCSAVEEEVTVGGGLAGQDQAAQASGRQAHHRAETLWERD